MELKEYIIKKSKDIGIDIIGITNGEPLFEIKDYLIERKQEKKEIEFENHNLNTRLDPKLTLPSCKSIIVIGISYNVKYENKPEFKLRGSLSKTSWGLDYHKVLGNKIKALIEEIKKETDFDYKYFVDTGPLVDRELARKAGIGSYGKNCSIINKDFGSFIFLGYILTDLEIEPDKESTEDICGDCDYCLRACPTKALEGPYRLNPKKCISYLTQTKDEIPKELREKMGIKIYGCDTCQIVCPKNKGVKLSTHEEFVPKVTKGYMDIKELLNISNRAFKNKYGFMSGSWRGKTILKRNAIIALGNMKNPNNLPLLLKELNDSNEIIRKYSGWAISNIYKGLLKDKSFKN